MSRPLLCALLVVAAFGAGPARAQDSIQGHVLVATDGPTAAHVLYIQDPTTNGILGYVLPLRPGAPGKPYTLTRNDGLTGLEDLSVWFYPNMTDPSAMAYRDDHVNDDGATEHGTIAPGCSWAIVYIGLGPSALGKGPNSVGADAGFTFSY